MTIPMSDATTAQLPATREGDFPPSASGAAPARSRSRVVTVLCWLALLPGAGWLVARLAGWDSSFPLTQLMAFTPYVAAASLAALLLALGLRRWRAAGLALLVVALFAGVVGPRWLPDSDPLAGAQGPTLRVLTANTLAGDADPKVLVDLVRQHDVQVLALQELTPGFVDAARAAGLFELLPHLALHPDDGTEGSGIASRYPLRDDGHRVNPGGFWQAKAEITVPAPDGGGARQVLVESAHPFSPYAAEVTDLWLRSFDGQPKATADGPARILLGDFNATLDHRPLRDLIDSGYRDAADVVGAGLVGTWGWYDDKAIPPVTIDHVLADRRVGVRQVRVFDLPGSDHRPVLAELVLP
jgi:endonuclease/exonuclease/phosphatase family metal-dependent hydrolase